MRFGRLLVLGDIGHRKWGQIVWRCRCDCGNEANITSAALTSGHATSCGCYRRELVRERNHRTRDELGKRLANVAARHNFRIELPAREVTWRTKLPIVCPGCGHKRCTDVASFLARPSACRHCSKRMPTDELRAKLAERMITLEQTEYPPARNGQGIGHCQCMVCHQRFHRKVGELNSGNRGCPNCLNIQE